MRPATGTAEQQLASNRRRACVLIISLAFIAIASWGVRAADDPAIKPFALEVEPPQVIQTGAMFPYLWLLRDGSVLMFEYIAYKVASGKYEGRMWKSDAGWRTFGGAVHLQFVGAEL